MAAGLSEQWEALLVRGAPRARRGWGVTSTRDPRWRPWPREHGAYGQLGLPLVTALAMGTPAWASFLWAIAAVAAFLMHEPAVVLLGRRGPRMLRANGSKARRMLLVLCAVAIVATAAGMATAAAPARTSLLLPAMLALIASTFVFRDREKTAGGELAAGAALASAALPVAVASGVPVAVAWTAWLLWTASFTSATMAVRLVVRRATCAWSRAERLAVTLLPMALAAAAAPLLDAATMALATVPLAVTAATIAIAPPHPRALRSIGWTLMAATLLVAVGMIVAVRVVGVRA
jgi:hypothetical protein